MRHFLATSLALLFLAGPVYAVVLPDDMRAALEQRYDTFVIAPGFTEVESPALLEDWDTDTRFPNRDPDSFERSDAGINAATKALMLLLSQEPLLPHARYRITYRLDSVPDFGGYTNAYVEVTRFNLGPVRRVDVADSTPQGVPIAPAEHFGIGPSVSWRFVMGWHQSRSADVVRASRSVLSAAQAEAMDCLGAPCMAMESPQGPGGEWQPATAPSIKPATYIAQENGMATAARICELLYRDASAGQDQLEALPMHAAEPQLTFVISMNIEGQDYATDGLTAPPTAAPGRCGVRHLDAASRLWCRYSRVAATPWILSRAALMPRPKSRQRRVGVRVFNAA